jgi:hypothetical protein
MEIKIDVTLSPSAELLDLIKVLFKGGSCTPVAETPVKEMKSSKKVTEEKKVESTPVSTDTPAETSTPGKVFTLEDVRQIAREKKDAGKLDKVEALLPKYNATKLSNLPKEHFAAFIEDVKQIA